MAYLPTEGTNEDDGSDKGAQGFGKLGEKEEEKDQQLKILFRGNVETGQYTIAR